jgi:DNA (cytosine-5)-methyltransferase 1
MSRPKLLDLFCKQGGASMGYHLAGFEVTGVDKDPQPNYPFAFVQADALEYLAAHGHKYDVIAASPPCQKYSRSTKQYRDQGREYADLLGPTRELLQHIGKPYIIENVPGSPMRQDVILCGLMFRLNVVRVRWFELGNGLWIMSPCPTQVPKGIVKRGHAVSVFGKGAYRKSKGDAMPVFDQGSVKATWRYAMGIDWMDCEGLREAIPPAYTQWIGENVISFFQKNLQHA